MKLRSIALNNVRRFAMHSRIEGIGDGLNLLCEPNEHGKSTVFDAVHALFFLPHGSQTREVKALRPHAGGAPAMEEAAVAAGRGPDESDLRRLEALAADLSAAIAARNATAIQLIMAYAPGCDGMVSLEGIPLAEGQLVPAPRGGRIDIAGLGRLDVRPGHAADEGVVDAAEAALRKALASHKVVDILAARAAAEQRAAARLRHAEARASFESLAPEGIEALRRDLAQIPEASVEAEGPSLRDAERTYLQAEEARIAAQSAREAIAERLADARDHAVRTETAAVAAADRVARAEQALRGLGDATEDVLREELAQATASLEAAEALHEEKRRAAAPDLAAAEAGLRRARAVEDEARAEIARLRPELAALDERIVRSSGDAVEERLATTEQELEAATAELGRIEREVSVLRKLEAALEKARTEARERYFEPVAAELKPLLQLLWPDASLTWGHESLLPEALIRNGQEEPIGILSGGTQEQIALLVRLAFARMLARSGQHAPVILDDALVFSDDDRIERMFDALNRQAGDLQIIVFSCRQRAFRELGGRTLRFETSGGAEEAA